MGPEKGKKEKYVKNMSNEELGDLYVSQNINDVFKLRRVRWVGHEERKLENKDKHTGFWLRTLKEEDYLLNLGVDGKII